jgi:hypothetical protein
MTAPTNATHWVSGTVSGSLTTDRIRKLHADRGVGARVVECGPPTVAVGEMLDAECPLGAEMTFEVVAIERTVDDEGRASSSGAAIIYLREVSR